MSDTCAAPPPIHVSWNDFRLYDGKVLYVDKTMIVKEIIDHYPIQCALLFTRPGKFGKTMLATMLRAFFEKSEEDTSRLFKNTAIWACGEKYRAEQGKYPVIHLSFKDVRDHTWEEMVRHLALLLRAETDRHREILNCEQCNRTDIWFLQKLIKGEWEEIDVHSTLSVLSRSLSLCWKQRVVIILDDYDTPLRQAYENGFYREAKEFFSSLFLGGFKDNEFLKYGFIMGILQVGRAGLFDGYCNLESYSVLDEEYSEYFGFTEEEVRHLADTCGHPEKYEEISSWYNGYCFGNTRIYNPWSVLNYFSQGFQAAPYWVDAAKDGLSTQMFAGLQEGEPLSFSVNMDTISPDPISFLFANGYLTSQGLEDPDEDPPLYRLRIPNREVLSAVTLLRSQIRGL